MKTLPLPDCVADNALPSKLLAIAALPAATRRSGVEVGPPAIVAPLAARIVFASASRPVPEVPITMPPLIEPAAAFVVAAVFEEMLALVRVAPCVTTAVA